MKDVSHIIDFEGYRRHLAGLRDEIAGVDDERAQVDAIDPDWVDEQNDDGEPKPLWGPEGPEKGRAYPLRDFPGLTTRWNGHSWERPEGL